MNTKKLALALFPLLLAFASCMNIDGSSGKEGAIRVTLPESGSRGTYTLSKDNPLYEVSLMQGDKTLKTLSSESTGGGDFVFDELEPGTYKIVVTARQQDGTFLARNSAEVEVTAGETQNCPITLILAGNKGKVFNSDYYVLTDSSGYTDFVNSVDSTTSMSSTQARLGAEDINGTQFSVGKSGGSSFEFYIFKNESNAATVAISQSGIAAIDDYIYYDTINDSLWLGAYSTTDENCIFFIKNAKEITGETHYSTPCTLSGISIYPNAQYTAFAASGTELYIAYTNDGTSYLQRAKIEGENDSFTITTIGNPKSTQDMGVDGQITDIVIHYDGYVYVLVSQNGEKYATDAYLTSETTKAIYSRGAILRLYSTSNGFKVSAKTGWTEDKSKRTISTKGEASSSLKNSSTSNKNAIEFLDNFKNGLDLYIPNYSERNSHFYGPRRFVAIKPKELAIADSGANLMLPDYDKQKTGGFFKHNRVVNVDLYKFAIDPSSVVELNSNIISFVAASINTTIGFSTDSYTGAKEEDE
ncbi:carboxypeptidase-like regulatory domain-containing protein [uncultured Treponema sp.]|uniref:carboxypeptidase-like regulatory domain-containing protein n=1 Tax=uncultured Treponema sp. TaxID=162155 RepID=UPI00259750C7|nr:carboxypeptidase-like regulatory domain-containing protein [uncultured Treponema sp.]